jgi:hypothetical protein
MCWFIISLFMLHSIGWKNHNHSKIKTFYLIFDFFSNDLQPKPDVRSERVITQNFQLFTHFVLFIFSLRKYMTWTVISKVKSGKLDIFSQSDPKNRQIWISLSSWIKKNTRRQNLFKQNFNFQGQIFNFYISPISLWDI